MIKSLISYYKNLDKKILHILKIGLNSSFAICIISSIILLTYLFYSSLFIYQFGILVLAIGLNLYVSFIISAAIIDNLHYNSHL